MNEMNIVCVMKISYLFEIILLANVENSKQHKATTAESDFLKIAIKKLFNWKIFIIGLFTSLSRKRVILRTAATYLERVSGNQKETRVVFTFKTIRMKNFSNLNNDYMECESVGGEDKKVFYSRMCQLASAKDKNKHKKSTKLLLL